MLLAGAGRAVRPFGRRKAEVGGERIRLERPNGQVGVYILFTTYSLCFSLFSAFCKWIVVSKLVNAYDNARQPSLLAWFENYALFDRTPYMLAFANNHHSLTFQRS